MKSVAQDAAPLCCICEAGFMGSGTHIAEKSKCGSAISWGVVDAFPEKKRIASWSCEARRWVLNTCDTDE